MERKDDMMTQSEQIKKSKLATKRRNGFLALFLGILMLLTGTFAWQSMQQVAFNPMWRQGNLGGRFHDRFEITDEPIRDLTIFAENFGNEDILLRVRLREFFAVDEAPLGVGNANRDEPLTWPIYLAQPSSASVRRPNTASYTIGDAGVVWTMGQTAPFVFMPTFNHAVYPATDVALNLPVRYDFNNAHRMTEATGNAVDWFSNADAANRTITGNDEIEHVRDILEIGSQTGPGLNTALHQTLDDGSRNNWEIGDYITSPYLYTEVTTVGTMTRVDLNLGEARTHRAQNNLAPTISGPGVPESIQTNFNGVITIDQWNNWGRPSGNYWIMDTTNDEGWFYWNGYLTSAPGSRVEATSLLLAAVDLSRVRGDWEYVVVLDGEFFDDEGIEHLEPLVSEEALPILRPDEPIVAMGCPQTGTADNIWRDKAGVEWCIIRELENYSMMVARFGVNMVGVDGILSNQAHHEMVHMIWPTRTDATLPNLGETTQNLGPDGRTRLHTWWQSGLVSEVLREFAVDANIPASNDPNDVPYHPTSVQNVTRTNNRTHLSTPIAGTVGATTPLFFLNEAEANLLIGSQVEERMLLLANTNTSVWYWLRSVGSMTNADDDILFTGVVNHEGSFLSSFPNSTHGNFAFRPALWVSNELFEEVGRDIAINVDENGEVIIYPDVEYILSEDEEGNIIVTLSDADENDRIVVNLLNEDWSYRVDVDEEGNVIIIITPPTDTSQDPSGPLNLYIDNIRVNPNEVMTIFFGDINLLRIEVDGLDEVLEENFRWQLTGAPDHILSHERGLGLVSKDQVEESSLWGARNILEWVLGEDGDYKAISAPVYGRTTAYLSALEMSVLDFYRDLSEVSWYLEISYDTGDEELFLKVEIQAIQGVPDRIGGLFSTAELMPFCTEREMYGEANRGCMTFSRFMVMTNASDDIGGYGNAMILEIFNRNQAVAPYLWVDYEDPWNILFGMPIEFYTDEETGEMTRTFNIRSIGDITAIQQHQFNFRDWDLLCDALLEDDHHSWRANSCEELNLYPRSNEWIRSIALVPDIENEQSLPLEGTLGQGYPFVLSALEAERFFRSSDFSIWISRMSNNDMNALHILQRDQILRTPAQNGEGYFSILDRMLQEASWPQVWDTNTFNHALREGFTWEELMKRERGYNSYARPQFSNVFWVNSGQTSDSRMLSTQVEEQRMNGGTILSEINESENDSSAETSPRKIINFESRKVLYLRMFQHVD